MLMHGGGGVCAGVSTSLSKPQRDGGMIEEGQKREDHFWTQVNPHYPPN